MNKYNYLNASKILSYNSLYFGRAIMILLVHINTHPINASSTEMGKFRDHSGSSDSVWWHYCGCTTDMPIYCGCTTVTSETHSIIRRRWLNKSHESINTLRPRQDGRHFADDICKCTFLNEMLEISLKCHWNLFIRVKLTIFQHWFRKWLGADQATSHYQHHWWLFYWRIYSSLGLDELSDDVKSLCKSRMK